MKDKILFICNTYYQLIAAAQIKRKLLREEYVDVLLSDHSQDAASVAGRLNQEALFNHVFLMETKDIVYGKHSIVNKWIEIKNAVTGKIRFHVKFPENAVYDKIFYYNLEIATATIYARLYRRNPNMVCAGLEEGINSYSTFALREDMGLPPGRLKLVFLLRKILGKANMTDCLHDFYCFYPEQYRGKLTPVEIPHIGTEDTYLKNILSKAFQINPQTLSYKQKYIFFASVGDCEGGRPIGEVELAKKIAALVGKDNLLVKVHPRDFSGAFARAGLTIDQGSAVPWEIIQLNYNFNNHVFLTATSGSVLSVNLMSAKGTRTFFLYPLCDLSGNPLAMNAAMSLDRLFMEMHNVSDNIRVAKDLGEIM